LWLYYITDRKQLGGTPAEQRRRLLDKIAQAARCGVEFIQLREKDLSSRELENLAREALAIVRENSFSAPHSPADKTLASGLSTRLLINSRVDVAIAVGTHGVHLPSHDLSPTETRAVWDKSASLARHPPYRPLVGVSCHSVEDVRLAHAQGTDFAVFAPVFEKMSVGSSTKRPGAGLTALRAACHIAAPPTSPARKFPVFALGGITLENAPACVQAGAIGVAGIRLFQQNDVKSVVDRLKTLE